MYKATGWYATMPGTNFLNLIPDIDERSVGRMASLV